MYDGSAAPTTFTDQSKVEKYLENHYDDWGPEYFKVINKYIKSKGEELPEEV